MKNIIAILVLALVAAGCHREEKRVEDNPVIAIIDGRQLTANDVRDVVRARAKMMQLSGMKMRGGSLTNWMNSCAMQILPGLISADLLENEIKRLGEKPEAVDYEQAIREYNKATRQKAKTLDELAAKFEDAEEAFRRQLERSALFRAYNRRHIPKPAAKEDLPAFYANLTNKINFGKSIDALAHSKADAAWKRLEAGEEWEKVAKECSEDTLIEEKNAEFASDWATVGLEGMEYPELAKALPELNKGDWSKPLEIDEGLVIVKVVDVVGDRKTLARMIFRMAQPVDVPANDEAALKMIDSQRKAESADALMERLRAKAKIEYPQGETLYYKFWK